MKITEKFEHDHLLAQGRMAKLSSYYQWSLSHLGSALGKRVWDAGAGTGLIVDYLSDKAELILLTEYGQKNLAILNETFQNDSKVIVEFCDLLQADGKQYRTYSIDTVITLDVIEHLADDRHALQVFFDSLQPGGHIFIKTPAHQSLYCSIDEASLHYRRYTTSDLKEKLCSAGFEVSFCKYMNAPGALLYFLKGKIMSKHATFSGTFSNKGLSLVNKLVPFIRSLENAIPPPFGLSVVALGKKPVRNKKIPSDSSPPALVDTPVGKNEDKLINWTFDVGD